MVKDIYIYIYIYIYNVLKETLVPLLDIMYIRSCTGYQHLISESSLSELIIKVNVFLLFVWFMHRSNSYRYTATKFCFYFTVS
jgi:hypothetical protein